MKPTRLLLVLLICAILGGIVAYCTRAHADNPPINGAPLMTPGHMPHYKHRTNEVAPVLSAEEPATNPSPQVLQSSRIPYRKDTNTISESPVVKSVEPPTKPKSPGMVIYGVYGFTMNGTLFWAIPERYLADLTNHYPFQYATKIILPEP